MNEIIQTFKVYMQANLQGWWAVLTRGGRIVSKLFANFNVYMLLFPGACLVLIGLSLAHWIEYDIRFNEVVHTTLGSEMRYAFFIPGIFGLLLFCFKVPYSRIIYGIVIGVVAVLYILGWIQPGWIHTNMQVQSDYALRAPVVIVYGVVLAVMAAVYWEALRNPLLNQRILKEYLYAVRDDAPQADI